MPSRPRILGVDDNRRNLDILRRCFGDEFDFVSASSGEEALEIAPRIRPALILLDIMMPGIDGYETCRRMRSDSHLVSAKILMVSAKASTAERLEGYAAGADDYLAKPFDPDELLAKARVYCRLKSVEEVDALKSTFLTLLGHETRTPLTLILSPLSMLLEDQTLAPHHRELIRTMESGAERLLALIDRVSFLSDLKMGAIPLRKVRADLGAVAGAAAEHLAETAREAGVTLVVQPDPPAPILGDPEHLGRVVESLIDNAIRFSPQGETVEVKTGTSDGHAFLTVVDRGPGVSTELVPRLFQEYAVSDVGHHSRGHGLSLATGLHIADQHGGALLYQTGEGSGAMFRLEVPLALAPVAAA
jgi:two-component system sensor histidine kinase/response regulator